MKPKISFVMPQKNRGGRIKKSIEAIVAQTMPEWELIVIDDHSDPEDTAENVIREINDPRIRFIRMPDSWPYGIPSARNFGSMFAEALIIAVADSDDLSHPDRAKIILEKMTTESADVFFSNYEVLIEESSEVRPSKNFIEDFSPEMLLERNYIAHSTSAYTTEIARNFPYNSFFGKGEDYDLFLRLAREKKRFSHSSEVLLQYVVHDSNYSEGKRVEVVDKLLHLDPNADRREAVEEFISQIYR